MRTWPELHLVPQQLLLLTHERAGTEEQNLCCFLGPRLGSIRAESFQVSLTEQTLLCGHKHRLVELF